MAEYEFYNPKGGNWAYFAKNVRTINQFIKANQIEAARIGQVATRDAGTAKAFLDLGIRGGMRVPHLHINDKIYLLNEEQWGQFSKQIIDGMQTKLAAVKTIDFDQAMALGSVAPTLR